MHPLEKVTLRLLRQKKLVNPAETVVVAVSGGPDSMALLHVLARLAKPTGIALVVAHVNHGLRAVEAEREAALVLAQAGRLGIVCKTGLVDVPTCARNQKISIEQAARLLRYEFLEKVAADCRAQKIALAHTADDQVEETILRLIRGTGRKGLSGMKFLRDNKFIRPFLKISKTHLLEYLARYDIPFLEDSSNRQPLFLRNRVRLDLLPYLTEQFNANIRQTVLQTADVLQEEELLLEELARAAAARIFINSTKTAEPGNTGDAPPFLELNLDLFAKEARAIQRRVLETAFRLMENDPYYRQIEQILQVVESDKPKAVLHFAQGLRVNKAGRSLLFSYPQGKSAHRGNL